MCLHVQANQRLQTVLLLCYQELWDELHTDLMPKSGLNPLTPNDLYVHRAVSPLNSRTTYIYIANNVSKFGGILFTPILLTAVAC